LDNIQLIIFDLDGVLVDACEWHRLALNQALYDICNYEISLDSHHANFNGLPTKTKLQKLIASGVVKEEDCSRVYELKQEKTKHLIKHSSLAPDPDKFLMMKLFKSRGILVACCTNSIRETTQLMLEKSGLDTFLNYVVTNQDVNNPKPDPEGYLKIIEHFGISKDNIIIVEDSPKGLLAARATGCKVIQVKNATEVNIGLFLEIFN
jgi:HAD superfamily hydrolase (TIGR01509 family)